ncbi:MAG TPA: alpha-amylase family glycosyl hydrolase [Acidothermaceae bacterium]|jgi:hypothetical protein
MPIIEARDDRLEFVDRFFTAQWDAASGALIRLTRTDDAGLIFEAPTAAGLQLVVGGDPAENRVPEPARRPGEPLLQSGSLVPLAQPRPGEEPGSLVGADAVFDGSSVVDHGRDLAVTVYQVAKGWRFGLTLRFDRVAPLIRFDVRVQRVAAEAETLDWAFWNSAGWTFEPGIFDGLESELGYGAAKRLSSGGTTVFWRERESFGDGEFARWGPVQDSAIAQVMGQGDLAERPAAAPIDEVTIALFIGGRVESSVEFVGGGFVLGWSRHEDIRAARVMEAQLERAGTWAMPAIPAWAPTCHILETTIGRWPQTDTGVAFDPYPTTEHLIADLDRVRELGFDTIYLMPRHPFPGYTTASLTNLAVQYGDGEGAEDRFAAMVAAVHDHGMRIILDVILHGVLDQEALDQQEARRIATAVPAPADDARPAAGPRTGPYDWDMYERAHEVSWRAVAPAIHPYWIEHPEWFTQLPDGRAQFTYTRSFDLRHPGLQDFMIDTLVGHVVHAGIDGYRFDAPWWNQRCYRWQADAGYRPSWSTGAGRELVSRLYARILAAGGSALSFMESCDSTSAGSAHLQYPYDEMPVLAALMGRSANARQTRERLAYLRAVHAPGVVVAHWIDSHDSLAWAAPGRKWKREVYGVGALHASTFLSAMRDGAFMMFSGGEAEQEEWLATLLRLRRSVDLLRVGHCDELAVGTDDDAILPVLRSHGEDWLVAVTSWAGESRDVRLQLPARFIPADPHAHRLFDHVKAERVITWSPDVPGQLMLRLHPHESALIGSVTNKN